VKGSSHDPVAEFQRKSKAARRIGTNQQCACGERRPEALITGSQPLTCAACKRQAEGKRTGDDHHFAGKANSDATIPIFVNDHRADLSSAQYDWPKKTLQNRYGSPLLSAAGCNRGFSDTVSYLIESCDWIPPFLEELDASLVKKYGPEWWLGMELEKFVVKK